jgi:hypothetical protein
MISLVAICSSVCANHLSVNRPGEHGGSPVNGVGVEFGSWRVHRRLSAAVIVSSNTFSEVIGLHLSTCRAKIVS